MRKKIVITAVIAALGGLALGLTAGTYLGFWTSRYVVQVPLYERSVTGLANGSAYWQMAVEGKTGTIKDLARGQALMHAVTLNIIYDDLEKGHRMSVDRSFERILDLVERDAATSARDHPVIEDLRKRIQQD